MKFVRLDYTVLEDLKRQGFNILRSPMSVDSDEPTWYPERVDDIWEYLDSVQVLPLNEANILVIDDALKNIPEAELKGTVQIDF